LFSPIEEASGLIRAPRPVGYLLFRFAGKPVIAIPNGSRRIKLAGLNCYRGFTIRRLGVVWLTRSLTRVGADRLIFESHDAALTSLLPFDFADCLHTIQQSLDLPLAEAVIVWPPQIDRGRLYIHLLQSDGQQIAFVKLSLNEFNDRQLEAESQALQNLENLDTTSFDIPRLVSSGRFNQHVFCVFEPIPAQAKPIPNSKHLEIGKYISEFAGEARRITNEERQCLPWWRKFLETTSAESSFAQELDHSSQRHAISICHTHGDLGKHNMLQFKNRIMIFDWEEFCSDGPVLADELTFFLVQNQRSILSDPLGGLTKLQQQFLSQASPQRRHDVMAALAYIHTTGKPVATVILHNWDKPTNAF
jgi:hypothetical protein